MRLIAADRPGVGGSDPKRGRSVADWPADAEELADQLELDRFAVSGWSAGAAYALACAHQLQPRVDAVALVIGAGRLDLPGFVEQMSTATAWRLAARVPSAMTSPTRLEAARPVWIEGAGHFLIEDHVGEVLDVLVA